MVLLTSVKAEGEKDWRRLLGERKGGVVRKKRCGLIICYDLWLSYSPFLRGTSSGLSSATFCLLFILNSVTFSYRTVSVAVKLYSHSVLGLLASYLTPVTGPTALHYFAWNDSSLSSSEEIVILYRDGTCCHMHRRHDPLLPFKGEP